MDREAVTAPVAMSIALALFMGLFATLAMTSNEVGSEAAAEASDTARLHAQARSLLDQMLQSPGYSADGGDWIRPDPEVDDPSDPEDTLVRLGLLQAGMNRLDFNKFENLRLAAYAAGTDDRVNYEEARSALGFDDAGLGFHIRAKPSLKSVRDILANGEKDPNLRITYLSATTSDSVASQVGIEGLQCVADGTQLEVSLTVKNDGDADAQLSAFITLNAADGKSSRSEWINGPVVAGLGGTAYLASSFPFHDDAATADVCGNGATLTASVWDSTKELKAQTVTLPGAGIAGHTHGLFLDTGTQYTLAGSDAPFAYGGTGLSNSATLEFTLTGPGGPYPPVSFTAGNVNKRTVVVGNNPSGDRVLDTGPLAPGTYTATLTHGAHATVTETLHVFGAPPGDYDDGSTFNSGITDAGRAEAKHLNDLVEYFCPFLHDDGAHNEVIADSPAFTDRCDWLPSDHGDIILDSKKSMDDDLPERLLGSDGLPRYDRVTTLVVGSNVNHQSMTSASAKHAVRDWVLDGGTLIVFGSNEQAVQWLQPIFHSGIQSSSGGIGTPDADHPLLQVSETLAYDAYSDHSRAWDLKSSGAASSADKFTNVVPNLAGDATILTISDPGAYGSGTIILTTWMPYDLFGDGSDPGDEGPKLVNNLLMQSYRGLFLDYGPPLPDGQAVVPATGKAQIYHPELDRLISLDVTLFVFHQS